MPEGLKSYIGISEKLLLWKASASLFLGSVQLSFAGSKQGGISSTLKSSSSTPPTLSGTSDFVRLLLFCIAELYFSKLAKLLNFNKLV